MTVFFVRFFTLTAMACLIGLAGIQPLEAKGKLDYNELAERLEDSRAMLYYRMQDPKRTIPLPLLKKCKAIVFIDQFRAGLLLGVKGGYGVALLKDDKDNWSPPAFYRVGGGSIGFQVGGEHRQTILLIMTWEGTRVLTGDSSEIGLDFSAAVGPSGVEADYSNFTEVPILVYSDAEGLYAGASFEGGVISPSEESNATFYKKEGVTALEILESRVERPAASQKLIDMLEYYVEQATLKQQR